MSNFLKNQNMYDSCGMVHPDGTLMTRCSKERAMWYINRNLASWMDSSEEMFQLNFEPHGYGNHDDKFYTEKLENICVVCGTSEKLTRHHVVPYQFRKMLPSVYKSRNHHDVLLVCWDCHERYERQADLLKDEIYKTYGLSFIGLTVIEQNNRKIRSSRKIINSLEKGNLKSREGVKPNIPENRLLTLQLKANEEIVEESSNLENRFLTEFSTDEKIHEFFVRWRQHFVDSTHPKFLPVNWKIEHHLQKLND